MLLWAGWVDSNAHLNLLSSSDGYNWNNSRFTYTQSASSGFGIDVESNNETIDFAWADTSSPHHINWGRAPINGTLCLNGSPANACQMPGVGTDFGNYTNTDVTSFDTPFGLYDEESQGIYWKGSAQGPQHIFTVDILDSNEMEGPVSALINDASITGIGGAWYSPGGGNFILTWADGNANLNFEFD